MSTTSIGGGNNGGKINVQGLKGALAGGIAGACEILITYPTEFAKTQMQLDSNTGKAKQYKGFIDCMIITVKKHGFPGLYRGLSVVLYGSVPKSGVRFGAYEQLKVWYQARNRKQSQSQNNSNSNPEMLTPTQSMICGLWGGVVSGVLVVTPVETIKIKLIDDQKSKNPKFKGFFHAIREIIRAEGFKGCYQGLMPTVIKNGSNQAIRFSLVETFKNLYIERERQTLGNSSKPTVPKWLVGVFGAVGGGVSVLANAPVDVVKTRMQGLNSAKYKNSVDCFVQIWKGEGVGGLYKGTVPRLTHSCAEVAIIFVVFDSIMEFLNIIW